MRLFFAQWFLRLGMALLPRDVRELVREVLMFHTPGALTEGQKAAIRAAYEAWRDAPAALSSHKGADHKRT